MLEQEPKPQLSPAQKLMVQANQARISIDMLLGRDGLPIIKTDDAVRTRQLELYALDNGFPYEALLSFEKYTAKNAMLALANFSITQYSDGGELVSVRVFKFSQFISGNASGKFSTPGSPIEVDAMRGREMHEGDYALFRQQMARVSHAANGLIDAQSS